jgi:membrane-bound ClpP family serine protease
MRTVRLVAPFRLFLFLALTGGALFPLSACAQEVLADGRFIAVPNPITSEGTKRIREAVFQEIADWKHQSAERRRDLKIIFDFNKDNQINTSKEFGLCYDLARNIRALQKEGVRTYAFVHGDLTGHAVLPALACQSLYLSSTARFGNVVGEQDALSKLEQEGYLEINAGRFPAALVRKMFDRKLVVVKSNKGGKEPYVDAVEEPEARTGKPVFDADCLAFYTQAKASELGLSERVAPENADELRQILGLPRSSLFEHPLTGKVTVWQIEVEGKVNAAMKETLKRRIQNALRQANVIVFHLQCSGGETDVAFEIGEYLHSLNKDPEKPVVTVAFVGERSSNTALHLALGCNLIVMNEKAKLGDFAPLLKDQKPDRIKLIRENLETLAKKQSYPPALVRAMVEKDVTIHRVTTRTGARITTYVTEEELEKDRAEKEPRWKIDVADVGRDFTNDENRTGYLTLSAKDAVTVELARYVVSDPEKLYDNYGVTKSQVHLAGADWLDDLAEFLQRPTTGFFLIMIGITCLILELKMPGVGLPGVIAAICFVLFFWSHSQLNGQVTWLAVLLFVLGLLLIGLEIFVLPGFGIPGLSGLLLVIGGLGLMVYGHWPRNNDEWVSFGQQVAPLGLSLLGAIVVAVILARYLPSIPFANRLLLKPQAEEEDQGGAAFDPAQSSEWNALLGAIGVAATPLRPAGKVQFGEQFIDVVAEGSYVVPGTRVQVIEIEGNRIVVKEV